MKTIIKYELVINKALRSALNYDTPDEQINEFIRFFGKHIGSDRIYIFEDCDEKHVTNNTYEWCADGIVPEIHELQNVDMDIIGWWYQAFGNEKNIIITDIEQIKDEHRESYNLLKAQNVKNLVVCPIRYKDEIKGFFGLDNPPESDTLGLTTFLDMIGTLLISLLKLRNSFTKSNKEAMLSSYSSLSSIYISMALVNVQTHRYHIVKTLDEVVKRIPKGCVATYAQVAELAGNKKMCRAVGNALHKNPNPDEIPCYRVVNAKGELSGAFAFGGAGEQAKRLRADGIEVIDGRVDLDKYGIRIVDDVIYTKTTVEPLT